MIDLNYQTHKLKKEEEPPMIVLMVFLTPFAILFGMVLIQSFLHGIY